MKRLVADLHVHTVLSPCADPGMTPVAVVRGAAAQGLDLVAICDHNAAGNAAAVIAAAEDAGGAVAVLPGIEITVAEEVHLVGLFSTPEQALAVAAVVGATLPLRDGSEPRWVGPQRLLTGRDEPAGREPRRLDATSRVSLEEAVELVHRHGGLAIAAHVDRSSFGLLAQLGVVPEGLALDALEVSAAGLEAGRAASLAALGLPLVASSDAHSTDELGAARTLLEVDAPTLAELALALRGAEGRRCALA